MSGHTPGPWRTFERPMGIEILCNDRLAPVCKPSAGLRIADVRFRRGGRGNAYFKSSVDEANARLIVAAPRLLSILETIIASLEVGALASEIINQHGAEIYAALEDAGSVS